MPATHRARFYQATPQLHCMQTQWGVPIINLRPRTCVIRCSACKAYLSCLHTAHLQLKLTSTLWQRTGMRDTCIVVQQRTTKGPHLLNKAARGGWQAV